MDLIIESEFYEPSIDELGNYIDYLPSSSKLKNGIRCHCGSRKEHIFDSRQSFSGHVKTKTHMKWLNDLNMNKMNYFTENIKLNETINNQKLIIAKFQRENEDNLKLIEKKKKKMEFKPDTMLIDLLTFD
jgi:hypothetical protein